MTRLDISSVANASLPAVSCGVNRYNIIYMQSNRKRPIMTRRSYELNITSKALFMAMVILNYYQ